MAKSMRVAKARRHVLSGLEKFIAVFAFVFVACPEVNALERIRIGLSVRNVVFLPFYYAQENGIYEKYGLHAELIQMRSDLQTVGLGACPFEPSR